jgi:23S rRNA pseudouridine2605 synthase
MNRQRLHKLMAACGVGSRRACEEIIAQGRVEVDGTIVTTPGTQVDSETQTVRCDGQVLRLEPMLYFLLNKPSGAICSMVSKAGRPRAVDYLPARMRDRRLFTIGRLDVDSEGALILTNDGELCHLVTHPRFGITKAYEVEVNGNPTRETIERMRKGVWLAEGRTGTVEVKLLRQSRERALLQMKLQEGKRREIRRICARFGHEVRRLIRVKVGPVELDDLLSGHTRKLSPEEIEALRDSASAVIRLGGATTARRTRPARRSRPVHGKPTHGRKVSSKTSRGSTDNAKRTRRKGGAGAPSASPGKRGAKPGGKRSVKGLGRLKRHGGQRAASSRSGRDRRGPGRRG